MWDAVEICMNIITNNLNPHTEKEEDYNERNDASVSSPLRFRQFKE